MPQTGKIFIRKLLSYADPSQNTVQKFATCVTDGCRCGVRYAEGFRAYKTGPVGRQLLGTI